MTDSAAIGVPRRPVDHVEDGRRARLWNLAGLVRVLAAKSVKVRYKRTSLGIVWAVAQPLLQALVITFVFERAFRGRAGAVEHYGLYVLSGVIPFSAASGAIVGATTSVVENALLVKKVALPRIVFPLSAAAGALTVFCAAIPVLVLLASFQGQLGPRLLGVVPGALLIALVSTAVGTLTSALYVQYRDVRFMVESGMLLLFYATPVLYQSDILGSLAPWQRLNPMTGVLSVFRASIAGLPVDWAAVGCTVGICVPLLLIGLVTFNRRAQTFADLT